MNPRRRHRGRDDRGLTTVELTVVAPILLWFIVATVQFGLWWHAKQVANAAAAEAVDVAQVPDGTAADGDAAARDFLSDSAHLRNITVDVDRGTDVVTVEIQADAPRLVPGWAWGVTARAQAPVEQFVPAEDR